MMNSKLANMLANNIKNKEVVAEMIMHISVENEDIEHRLINLCLSSDSELVTKDILLKHMDKIKTLCMQYTRNIVNVDDISIVYVDNMAGEFMVTFKAQVTAWFKDKESADKGYSWYSVSQEDNEYKIKGTYTTKCDTHISFKDIDLE